MSYPKTFLPFVSIIMFILFLPLQSLNAQHMHDDHVLPEGSSIGVVDFGASCDEAVREDFDYALGMMHHMMYVSARQTFEKIIEHDPACAMAHWGIATSLFQPLWATRPSADDLQRGWEHISLAMNYAEAEREKLLIRSTADFFREPKTADFRTRIDRWVAGVETAYNAYPDDQDIAAIYGLTRLTSAQFADNPAPLFDEAERVLRNVFEKNTYHPGAIHYTIHATDADGRAENALDMVEAYGNIAPEVPHALHMPSHIYVRLGDWPAVIDWNRQSADAALNFPVNGAESHHYIHAIDYLVYAYLQRGDDEKAESVYRKALEKERHQASIISTFHFAATPARLAVEKRDWEGAIALKPREPAYLPWDDFAWAEGITWYARGLGFVQTGDINGAKTAEEKLNELRSSAKERGDDNIAVYIETDRLVLAGWIALAEGKNDKAIELTRQAAEMEQSVQKHPITPGALQPPNEALGDMLMKLNRPEEALVAYEASDEIWPGRFNTLTGAALAARLIGDEQKARKHLARLLNSGSGELDPDMMDVAHDTGH